jgi:hypothetical protein
MPHAFSQSEHHFAQCGHFNQVKPFEKPWFLIMSLCRNTQFQCCIFCNQLVFSFTFPYKLQLGLHILHNFNCCCNILKAETMIKSNCKQ